MEKGAKTIDQIGESGLLQLVQAYCPADIVGDDAAILDPVSGNLVVTTDVLVEAVHFSEQTTPAFAVGWRAAAANLSDLAAMGSTPLALVIGLGLPPHTPIDWIEQLYQGMRDCCQPWQVNLVGGDLCRSATRFIAITALGQVQPQRAIRRKQARPGDSLLITGPHGDSRAGLEVLLHPERATQLSTVDRQRLIHAHQFPHPRLDLLPMLDQLPALPGSRADGIAGMDTSDGLADALLQVCAASGVNAIVDPTRIPQSDALIKGFPAQALEWALYGGEDFELLLSLPGAAAAWLLQHLPTSACIGTVVAANGTAGQVELQGIGPLQRQKAFQHFASTGSV